MPSPVGHALAGLAVVWVDDIVRARSAREARRAPGPMPIPPSRRRLVAACAGLAMAADLDFLTGHHHTVTHSFGAVLLVGVAASLTAARAGWPVARTAGLGAVAYATHVILDLLAADLSRPPGLMLLWPLSTERFVSRLHVFLAPYLFPFHDPLRFLVDNTRYLAWELLLILPVIAVLAAWRRRALLAPRREPG